MKVNKYVPINTDRLLLRMPVESDWKKLSYLRSDIEINQFVKRKSAETKDLALEFIIKMKKGIDAETSYYWVITEKPNKSMIGSICLWNFSSDGKKAEVGYDLHPDFQGMGIMDEALKGLMKFTFKNLSFEVIEAYTQHNNKNSVKLLSNNGFQLLPDIKDEANLMNLVFEFRKK